MTNIWDEIVKEKEEYVVVSGCCYFISERIVGGKRGFDGKHFKIKMLDSKKIIETDNLRFVGVIPEEYRYLLPNTAQFIV